MHDAARSLPSPDHALPAAPLPSKDSSANPFEGELVESLYQELRACAARLMSSESSKGSLRPTALVHEAYLRLRTYHPEDGWPDRAGWLRIANRAMRNLLVDHARRRHRQPGQLAPEVLDEIADVIETRTGGFARFDELADGLAARDPDAAEVVRARFLQDLTLPEIATALGISARHARRLLTRGLLYLKDRLPGLWAEL